MDKEPQEGMRALFEFLSLVLGVSMTLAPSSVLHASSSVEDLADLVLLAHFHHLEVQAVESHVLEWVLLDDLSEEDKDCLNNLEFIFVQVLVLQWRHLAGQESD